jgi:hypothetical protein
MRFVRAGTLRPSQTRDSGGIGAAAEVASRPPDRERKTAGTAATLASGRYNDLAANAFFYDIAESRSSAELADDVR